MNYLQRKKLAFMSIVNKVKGFVRTVSGKPPLSLPACVDNDSIIEYKIYGGNESVGERTINILDTQNMPVVHGNPSKPVYRWERTKTGFKGSSINNIAKGLSYRHGWIIGTTEELKGKSISISYGEAILYQGNIPRIGVVLVHKDKLGVLDDSFDETMPWQQAGYVGSRGNTKNLGNTTSSTYQDQCFTITIPEDSDAETYPNVGVLFYISSDVEIPANSTFEYKDIQVEISDTVNSYEPYGYKIPITASGKNILDVKNAPIVFNTMSSTSIDVSWERTETGFRGVFCKDFASTSLRMGYIIGLTKDFKGKTLTISFGEAILNEGTVPIIAPLITTKPGTLANIVDKIDGFRDIASGYIGNSSTVSGFNSNLNSTYREQYHTFTIPEDADDVTYPYFGFVLYIGYRAVSNPMGSTLEFKDIQVEIGETKGVPVNGYEPYIEPVTTNIYIDEPLEEGQTISYPNENVPKLTTFKGTTIYTFGTEVQPSSMEATYYSTQKGESI